MKNRNQKGKTECKNNKIESIKKLSKKLHFSTLILKCQNKITKTWQVIKKVVGKENCNELKFPLKKVADETNITNIHSIAENFNKYFTKIETCLTKKTDPPNKHFHEYFKEYQTSLPENSIFVNELKDTFFSSKITKTLLMTTLVSMFSKSVLEFYANISCIFLVLLVKVGIFQMNLKLQVLLLYLKDVKNGTSETIDLLPF